MIGPGINTVFRSRWNALFWAAGVLLTAYCAIPAPDEESKPDQQTAVEQDKAVKQVIDALKAQDGN